MTEFEILEGNGYKLHLKVLFEGKIVAIAQLDAEAVEHLAETILDPVPQEDAGDHAAEIVIDDNGLKEIHLDIGVSDNDRSVSISVPVDDEHALNRLYQTTQSPNPFMRAEAIRH